MSTGCRSATSTRAIRATSWPASTAPPSRLVTPLRDGMNLVAKEYVAAQDPDDPGVLILSRFAGAAHSSRRRCWSIRTAKDEISDAIKQGARHARDERIRRWQALIDNVRSEDVRAWRKAFVAALERGRLAAIDRLASGAAGRPRHDDRRLDPRRRLFGRRVGGRTVGRPEPHHRTGRRRGRGGIARARSCRGDSATICRSCAAVRRKRCSHDR